MQKDIHFYLTYALARKIGIPAIKAETIAWADQFTDDLTAADLHGIQTQSDVVGNWDQRQVQLSVLVPFHFIPGDDQAHPWMTTRDSGRARKLVDIAAGADLFQLGIALHAFQDTFSHEKFSGWREDLNSCYPWYYVKSGLPNVGHAEMRVIPDVVNYVWTDPRDGQRIDNRKRTMSAARGTHDFLKALFGAGADVPPWGEIKSALARIFKLDSYDERIDALCLLSENAGIDYARVTKRLTAKHKPEFVKAASRHLAEAIELFRDLPWVA